MIKILVVTPNEKIHSQIAKILAVENLDAERCLTGEKALERIWSDPSFLIILDIDLTGISGLDVLRILRQDPRSKKIPILAFSSKLIQAKILTAFNLQADDFLSYPFHPHETIARLKAVMNRKGATNYSDSDALIKGKIKIEPAHHRVTLNGDEILLTPKEYELLSVLLIKEGRVLSRNYLIESVWGLSKDITTRSVDMAMARLRKKLGKEGTRWIETVQGYGYRIPKD